MIRCFFRGDTFCDLFVLLGNHHHHYFLSFRTELRLSTRVRHPLLSWAFRSSCPHVRPATFASASVERLQVVFGHPRLRFPWGVHRSPLRVTLSVGFLSVCPSQRHLRLLICCLLGNIAIKLFVNPLRPNNDLTQTSHYNIKGLSVSEVMRIENMITQVKFY